jgi:AraC-like DNA-binding protein
MIAEENLALRVMALGLQVSVSQPTGGGARDPRVLLNDRAHQLDGHPIADFDKRTTYDTYDGQNQASGPDWYTLSFAEPVTMNCIEMTMGFAYYNGGWWTSLAVEVQGATQGEWQPVQGLAITPAYAFIDSRGERRPYETYEITFGAVATRAVRLVGRPGGLAQFTSLARIAVYQRDLSRHIPAAYLASAPVPELFRLISPQVAWDLSASLRKLTGLLVRFPLMEFYLDQERYQQCWQVMRRVYEGEPQLWFMLGETLGWDTWSAIDPADDARGALEPYVRLSFHDTLGRAVAPIVIGGRVVSEMSTNPALVREHFDWRWHRRCARQYSIPWPAYRAAVQRSPLLSMEQLDGLATLISLTVNSIAHLVYRLDHAHADIKQRSEQQKEVICRAIEFMQSHLEESIGVAEIARAVALSPHYFSELFTEQVGLAPSEYLIYLRIERAKEYLAFTGMSPTEVCLTLGYSPSYFWRLFKGRTGSTPGGYARRMRSPGTLLGGTALQSLPPRSIR